MKTVRIVPAIVFMTAWSMLAPSAFADGECQADIRATPKSDQVTDEAIIKVWAVEVDTQEQCAQVYGDLIVTERLFNGEEITSTHRGSRKVSNHTSTYKVNYRIAKDSTLTDWKFKMSRCVPCGAK